MDSSHVSQRGMLRIEKAVERKLVRQSKAERPRKKRTGFRNCVPKSRSAIH